MAHNEAERRVIEAIRAGCNAADIHLRCSYPECGCKQTPTIVRAALALPADDGWRPAEQMREDAARFIDNLAKAASKEGDVKRKREFEYAATLIRELPLPSPPDSRGQE